MRGKVLGHRRGETQLCGWHCRWPLGAEAEREFVPWLMRWRVNLEHSEHAGLH